MAAMTRIPPMPRSIVRVIIFSLAFERGKDDDDSDGDNTDDHQGDGEIGDENSGGTVCAADDSDGTLLSYGTAPLMPWGQN